MSADIFSWHNLVEATDAAKHCTMHRPASLHRTNSTAKMSTVTKLRNPGFTVWCNCLDDTTLLQLPLWPQSPHPQNGDDYSTCFTGWLWGLSESYHVKHLEQWAHHCAGQHFPKYSGDSGGGGGRILWPNKLKNSRLTSNKFLYCRTSQNL